MADRSPQRWERPCPQRAGTIEISESYECSRLGGSKLSYSEGDRDTPVSIVSNDRVAPAIVLSGCPASTVVVALATTASQLPELAGRCSYAQKTCSSNYGTGERRKRPTGSRCPESAGGRALAWIPESTNRARVLPTVCTRGYRIGAIVGSVRRLRESDSPGIGRVTSGWLVQSVARLREQILGGHRGNLGVNCGRSSGWPVPRTLLRSVCRNAPRRFLLDGSPNVAVRSLPNLTRERLCRSSQP